MKRKSLQQQETVSEDINKNISDSALFPEDSSEEVMRSLSIFF
jgi:hypothetical protein